MYEIVELPPQRALINTATALRFAIENLPLNRDVLAMKLNMRFHIDRDTASSGAVTIAQLKNIVSSITLRAFNRTLIDRLSWLDVEGLGYYQDIFQDPPIGAAALAAGILDIDCNMNVIYGWCDPRQDEGGMAFDLAEDTNLLLINGAIDVQTIAQNLGYATSWVDITPMFLCMKRKNLYARPYTIARKWPHPAITGIRIDRGCWFDLFAVGNVMGTPIGFFQDPDIRVTARWGGEAFLDNVLLNPASHLAWYSQFSAGALTAMQNLAAHGRFNYMALIHRQMSELSTLSKARRMLESEGRVDFVPGAIIPCTSTAVEIIGREVMPVDDNHFALVCRANGIDPDTAGVVPLGNGRDPYQPVMIK